MNEGLVASPAVCPSFLPSFIDMHVVTGLLPVRLFAGGLLVVLTCGRPAAVAVDVARVQQLLSDRCNFCHGPDAARREADLRLDTPAGVHGESNHGGHPFIVVPGDAGASELMRRIESGDPGERMPPPESNLGLSADEVELLRAWIAAGAPWQEHWSFQPIQRPLLPDSHLHPIDRFIDSKLQARGLTAQPAADRATQLRRLSLDLSGLPPDVDELQAFLTDPRPEAYQRQVDRLLSSARFGEHMAVPWLDAARYADTYGYQADVYREMWPWRDWVIDAFNANMPYDQFLTYQIAGDLIQRPTRDSILATAFNRHHRQTNEGGSIEEEFQAEYVADRVNTLGTAVLGLTLECARCHDHKYDPISQEDYYQLFAYFNNIDESGLYSHFTKAVPTPTLWLPTADQEQRLEVLNQDIAKAEANLAAERNAAAGRFSQWLQSDAAGEVEDHFPDQVADFRFDTAADGAISNEVDAEVSGQLREGATLVASDRTGGGRCLKLTGEDGFSTVAGGGWTRDDPFTIGAWLKADREHKRAVIWHRSRAWTDAGSRGYELLLEDGHLSVGLIHFYPGNAIRVVAKAPLAIDQWQHVTVRYDGSSRAAGVTIFVNGQRLPVSVVRDCLNRTINGGGADQFAIGFRFRDRGFTGGQVDRLQMFARDLTDVEIEALAGQATVQETLRRIANEDAQTSDLWHLDWYCGVVDSPYRQATSELRQARQQRSQLVQQIREIMVMRERETPRQTFVLQRGLYDAPGDKVRPGTPAALTPEPLSGPANRLGLAQWLVSDRHPLTARVAVNRIWQHLFGVGLVATAEDFGRQGQMPSHPELLDFLAADFIDSQWDVKRLVRLIVTSDAYRRDPLGTAEQLAIDPENRWLARGPNRRLGAESLRDAYLFAGGLLAEVIGGPSVKPYQPQGLWKEKGGAKFSRDRGIGSHRRSIYTFWKRTSPPPSMLLFDAPDRETCVAARQPTATPLQALVTLNDEQFVEAARGCAARVMQANSDAEGMSDSAAIGQLCLHLLSRPPSAVELEILSRLLAEQREYFAGDRAAAEAFLDVGDFQVDFDEDDDGSVIELAALTATAQALMNYAPAVR